MTRYRSPARAAIFLQLKMRISPDVGVSGTGGFPDAGLGDCVREGRCRMVAVVLNSAPELCGQEFQDPLIYVGGTLHHHEMPDAVDQPGL